MDAQVCANARRRVNWPAERMPPPGVKRARQIGKVKIISLKAHSVKSADVSSKRTHDLCAEERGGSY